MAHRDDFGQRWCFGRAAVRTAGVLLTLSVIPAGAQTPTPDPSTWRPVSYADLQHASSGAATYADIWKDRIEANNQAYVTRGDARFAGGNAPAAEAHFVIWSTAKSVVLSILDTAIGCTVKEVRAPSHATVKLCPLRIAVYEGLQVRTMEGGRACFLELDATPHDATPDLASAVSYASYDTRTKTIKIGVIVDHKAVEGCSISIPLYPS